MAVNYNSFMYTQELQGMRDRIDRQLQQMQQNQNQFVQQPQQPQIQQTFQLSNPNQNNSDFEGKYVGTIEDVKNTLVFKNSLFVTKDMNKMWLKDVNGNIRIFNLQEEVEVDENVAEINSLKKEVEDLKVLLVQQLQTKKEEPKSQPITKIQPTIKVEKKK